MKKWFIFAIAFLLLASCATKAPESIEPPALETAAEAPVEYDINAILAGLGVGNVDTAELVASAFARVEAEEEAEAAKKVIFVPQKRNEVDLGLPYRGGKLVRVVDIPEYSIEGVIIAQASTGHEGYLSTEELLEEGYGTMNLYNEFYIGEWFAIYMNTPNPEDEVNILVIKHDDARDYTKMLPIQIEAIGFKHDYPMLWNLTPEATDHGYMSSTYIGEWCGPGVYDILFMAWSDVQYMVQINVLEQPK